jgi:ferredoxin
MGKAKTEGKHDKSGATIKVDRNACISAASCVSIAPGTFQLDEEEGKVMIVDPAKDDIEEIITAAKSCPVGAITIIDEDGQQLWPPI